MSPRGGKRTGAGRKPIGKKRLRRMTVSLSDEHIDFLTILGNGNLSAGIRTLIDGKPGE
jgi:hypothetical protein